MARENTLRKEEFNTVTGTSTIKKMPLQDSDKMPWGKYKGDKMIDVPASYLLWLWNEKKATGEVAYYIKENLEVLNEQVKREKQQ